MVCHGDTNGQHQIIHSETFLCIAVDDVLYHCITAWQSDFWLVGSTSDPCFCCQDQAMIKCYSYVGIDAPHIELVT
jgi:hypothetical protein